MSLVKEALKPALRTVDAIMSKFGVGKKDAQKFLNSKFKREQVKGGAKVAAVGTGLWAASNFMKSKLGIYPSVPSKKTTSPSKGLGSMKGGRGNQGSGSAFDKAFRKAKDEGKAKFPWRGRMYHTRTKKEETAYKAKALYGRKKRG